MFGLLVVSIGFASEFKKHAFTGQTTRAREREYLIPASLIRQHRTNEDIPWASRSASLLQRQARSSHTSEQHTRWWWLLLDPLALIKDVFKALMACTLVAWMFKSCGGCCKFNIRRFVWVRRFLLLVEYDEFEEFKMHVLVHSMKDVETQSGLLSKAKFRVRIKFGHREFLTAYSDNKRWNQSRILCVPQGATECKVQICQKHVGKDKILATRKLEVSDMLERPGFLATKQLIKLQQDNRDMGSVYVTFRLAGAEEQSSGVFEGLDEDSALAMKLREIMEDEGYPALGVLEGIQKQKLLAKVICGTLKTGKGDTKMHVQVKYMLKAQLLSDKGRTKLKAKIIDAKGKGKSPPPELAPMWYWCEWKIRDGAHDPSKLPKTFFPFSSILSIRASPKEIDGFTVRVKQDDDVTEKRIFHTAGTDRAVWVDAIEHLKDELRDLKSNAQQQARRQAEIQRGIQRGWAVHDAYITQYGSCPSNEAEWKNWTGFLAQKGLDFKVIAAMREKMETEAQWNVQDGEDSQSASESWTEKSETQNSQDDRVTVESGRINGWNTGAQPSQTVGAQPSQWTGAQPSQWTGAQPSQWEGAQASQWEEARAYQTAEAQAYQTTGAAQHRSTEPSPERGHSPKPSRASSKKRATEGRLSRIFGGKKSQGGKKKK